MSLTPRQRMVEAARRAEWDAQQMEDVSPAMVKHFQGVAANLRAMLQLTQDLGWRNDDAAMVALADLLCGEAHDGK